MEASMLSKRTSSSDIRQLLASVHMKKKKISQIDIVEQLGLEPEFEASADFTSNELSLLEQLRSEQLSLNKDIYWWNKCRAVTTMLYNAAVRQFDNPSLKSRKRSFRTIEKYLVAIGIKLETRKTLPSQPSILGINKDKIIDDQVKSEDDDWPLTKLFSLLREKGAIKKRTQMFLQCI
ncbi:hypothetical protein F442_21561 [Phytophthora nicotianae P10297]|uniref:Uncharacterized protein n=1 Tax=Phytophthora nicotianae P10297 TaxID=1317064 RepID=W2Y509_PHYNI|nr:hypothetical protein F442_21561 [Phytophthora nicotianae P10297]